MKESDLFTIFTDGAARGNPGPAAFAYIIERAGAADIEVKECLGETTNNVAEYTALVRALEHGRQLGGRRLLILSDSNLLVQQMNGTYQVKNEGLRPLYDKARVLCRSFDEVKLQHIPREENGRADRLCNQALDGDSKPLSAAGRRRTGGKVRAKSCSPQQRERINQDAVQCLRTMAAAWARGNPQEPKPEEVWDQLWSILEEGGVVQSAPPQSP